MKKMYIADVTLRVPAVPGEPALSFKEKLEIARYLEKLHVDVIELPAISDEKTDPLLIRTIASFIANSTLSITAGLTEESVGSAWNDIKNAVHPRLRIAVPVSTVLMEYVCHKKQPALLKLIAELVTKAKSLCPDVEFFAEDAVRAEHDFLVSAIETAVSCGATAVTVCDSEGSMLPDEFGRFVSGLIESVPALSGVRFGVQTSASLDMATACALSGVLAGADEIKAAAGGGNSPSEAAIAQFVKLRGDSCGVTCGLNQLELQRITKQINWITNTKRSSTSPFDSGIRDSAEQGQSTDFTLNVNDGLTAVRGAVKKLGYDLSEDDNQRVFEAFQRVARKKDVGPRELDAIVASTALQVPSTYKLVSYVINSGNIISSTAHIVLSKNGADMQGFCLGDGPIDAAFLALEQIAGRHYELDDFQIQSVTEGREAMGSALVKLRSNGKLYSGNGISTDIIGAAIHAYVNALNKIVYEET
ncbi:MAG: hypothetical protein IKR95_02615 [Oscillospiraceae bacterium]|nr:hypothetical protein [Oscillospiraceae bacterium]